MQAHTHTQIYLCEEGTLSQNIRDCFPEEENFMNAV